MAIVKMISSKSSFNLVHYILDGEAHNKRFTNDRNLYVNGHNVFTDYQNKFNSNYIASQFYAVRKVAGKTKKRTQVFHNIYSFSDEDFPPTTDKKELQKQAKQAYELVNGFLGKQLPKDSQYLVGIQRDGDGGKLHAHVAINSVLLNGKVLDTNKLSLLNEVHVKQKNKQKTRIVGKGVFEKIQDYLSSNFQKVTGRSYKRIERDLGNLKSASSEQAERRKQGSSWKEDLKQRIIAVASSVDNLSDFKTQLNDVYGVTVKEYQASTGKLDATGKKIKRLAYTYSFKDDSGKLHKSRDFRYTKSGGVRGLGTFARPQDLEQLVFLPKRQQEQQENNELNEIVENQINLDTVETVERSVNNGTKSITKQQSADTEETDFNEPTYTGTVKAVNQVNVSEVKSTDYDTTEYDTKTRELEQRNNEEIARRQQQEFIKLEQQRKERERKRKERERQRRQREQQRQRQQKQVDRHQTATNGNQTKQYNNVESTINTESKSRNDEPDFGGLS